VRRAAVNSANLAGETALIMACSRNADPVAMVAALLRRGADVNRALATNGRTALMLACDGGHEDATRMLLRHGAQVESRCASGRTALFFAASSGVAGGYLHCFCHLSCLFGSSFSDSTLLQAAWPHCSKLAPTARCATNLVRRRSHPRVDWRARRRRGHCWLPAVTLGWRARTARARLTSRWSVRMADLRRRSTPCCAQSHSWRLDSASQICAGPSSLCS
jgi:hypothetical protein